MLRLIGGLGRGCNTDWKKDSMVECFGESLCESLGERQSESLMESLVGVSSWSLTAYKQNYFQNLLLQYCHAFQEYHNNIGRTMEEY